ncbi:DUF1223 domain-containing protein [Mucilaginibacter flavus]|uniref:DUF1223 domain-containing protein n=1 Tax=Mucilaginibacter flavus TaxID=931504 RepID=UPI0025B5B5E5|nr:DUF1223 domain-containing protein [Mucilaginibacter flavus]MDN3582638.1 DUF1223 domain-containing protein [Mucilaginibacter flavus]
MKPIKFLAIAVILIAMISAISAFAGYHSNPVKVSKPIANGKGFALLELFTSEGCSSCPPADELLARIQKETTDKPVYILAYHVDYWNRLGWKDVFSNHDFTNRQIAYNRFLNVSIYTPQVVINGKAECVGSDESALRDAIAQGLASAPAANVTLQAQQQGDKLAVNYKLTGTSASNQLLIAVVQKQAISKIGAGENSGRTLTHAQIVRELHTVALTSDHGTTTVKLPQGFNTQAWEIVGFIQSTSTGEVLTATRVEVVKGENS